MASYGRRRISVQTAAADVFTEFSDCRWFKALGVQINREFLTFLRSQMIGQVHVHGRGDARCTGGFWREYGKRHDDDEYFQRVHDFNLFSV